MVDGLRLEELGGAESIGYETDVGKVFEGLHLMEGIEKIVAVGYGPMIRHQDGGVIGDKGQEAIRELIGPGGGIGGQRHGPERHNSFSAYGLIERSSGAGEAGGDGRVGVDDGVDVLSTPIDSEVHANFAGHLSRSGSLGSVQVDDRHIVCLQKKFAASGGGDEDQVRAFADGEISGASGHEAESIQPLAESGEIAAELIFGVISLQSQGSSCPGVHCNTFKK